MMHEATKTKKNINDFTLTEKQQLMRKIYSTESSFQKRFNAEFTEFACPEVIINFRQAIENLLKEKKFLTKNLPLEQLHEELNDELRAYNFNDGVNKISTYFYETDSNFIKIYHYFIKHILQEKIFKQPLWFQQTPTIRIHCPNSLNSNHYPRYHSDISYGHPAEEVNIWFPLTEIMEGHGFRIMNVNNSRHLLEQSNYDFGPFIEKAIHDKSFTEQCNSLSQPVETPLGKIFLFDSRCVHSGEPVKMHTRISIDVRVVPVKEFAAMDIEYQGSGRRKILFKPGHCYHELSSNELLIE